MKTILILKNSCRYALLLCAVSLLGCENQHEDVGTDSVLYVPYFDRCESDWARTEAVFAKRKLDYQARVLTPDLTPFHSLQVNSLVELSIRSSDRGRVVGILNNFFSNCGPKASVSISLDGLNEDSIRRILSNSPGVYGTYRGHFDLQLTGEDLEILYTPTD